MYILILPGHSLVSHFLRQKEKGIKSPLAFLGLPKEKQSGPNINKNLQSSYFADKNLTRGVTLLPYCGLPFRLLHHPLNVLQIKYFINRGWILTWLGKL